MAAPLTRQGCPAGGNPRSYDATRPRVCSPNDTHAALQPCKQLGQRFLEQNGCSYMRGTSVSHWHLHVGKDDCRVVGEAEEAEGGEE